MHIVYANQINEKFGTKHVTRNLYVDVFSETTKHELTSKYSRCIVVVQTEKNNYICLGIDDYCTIHFNNNMIVFRETPTDNT